MENVNVDIFAKYQAAAGILAGFAFAAIFQILVTFKDTDELESEGSKFFYSLWLLVPGVSLLVSAYLGFAVATNYSNWFAEKTVLLEHLTVDLQVSTVIMWIGSLLLVGAIITAILLWGKKFIDPGRYEPADVQRSRFKSNMITGKWAGVCSAVFGVFWVVWVTISFLLYK